MCVLSVLFVFVCVVCGVCVCCMWRVCVVCAVCFVCVLCVFCVCILCVLQGVEIDFGAFLRDSHSTPSCCLHLRSQLLARMSTRKTVNNAHTHTFPSFQVST